jgi:hypothetical protein
VDGPLGDYQRFPDLAIRPPTGNQLHHVTLARGELPVAVMAGIIFFRDDGRDNLVKRYTRTGMPP